MYEVALLAEGVDRNLLASIFFFRLRRSPSSRRAWIEITTASSAFMPKIVALLAEGVDRNSSLMLSALCLIVALLAEGVDRNYIIHSDKLLLRRRPPRGGRG